MHVITALQRRWHAGLAGRPFLLAAMMLACAGAFVLGVVLAVQPSGRDQALYLLARARAAPSPIQAEAALLSAARLAPREARVWRALAAHYDRTRQEERAARARAVSDALRAAAPEGTLK